MAYDFWLESSGIFEPEELSDSVTLDLMRANNQRLLAEWSYEDDEDIGLQSKENDYGTDESCRNSPTLAELNAPMTDDFEFGDSSLLAVKRRRGPEAVQQFANLPCTASKTCSNDDRQKPDPLSSNKLVPVSTSAARPSETFVIIPLEQHLKPEITAHADLVPVTRVIQSTAVYSDANISPLAQSVKIKTEVDVDSDNGARISTGCLKSPTARSRVAISDMPTTGKGKIPPKKLKLDSSVVSPQALSECSRSSLNQSDDSDIENFDENISDDDAATSVIDSLRETVASNCSNVETQKRYFWLYNVQAKGPKGRSLVTAGHNPTESDPHTLSTYDDPASGTCQRLKSCDIEANPRRLLQIGAEIHRLTAVVNLTAGSVETSLSAREKNKYASRVCRLKRKAQHEANKIKLQGLNKEHSQLMNVLSEIKAAVVQQVREMQTSKRPDTFSGRPQKSLTAKLESLVKLHLSDMIAEHTNEYVCCELQKMRQERHHESV